MSLSKHPPEFESTLPDEFLKGLDERGKLLYTQIDVQRKVNEWLVTEMCSQSATLGAVKTQTEVTNGRLLKAEANIVEIKAEQVVIKEGLSTVTFIKELVQKKWFWVVILFITFVAIPAIATAPSEGSLLRSVWTAIFG